MELKVLDQVVPVIEFNKEQLKESLQAHLEKYSNLAVTVDTEKDCKKAKAELNKLEKTIDTFRIETKRYLSEPITKFEAECKELIVLIQEVKKPIDTQLQEIEQQRKLEKEALIHEEIAKIIAEYELEEKYSVQIQIQATWLNKSTSMSKITTEIKNLAESLKTAQLSVVRHKQIIETTCELYNERLNNKIDACGWIMQLEHNVDVNAIVGKIHDEGKRRVGKEMEEVEKATQEIMNAPDPEPVVHEEPVKPVYTPKPNEPIYGLNIRIYGTEEQFAAFPKIMASIGIKYEKLN